MIRTTLNWTVKNLKSMYDEKETLSFDHPIQRQSGQWSNEQQSLLIHSMLADFPVPSVYVHKMESTETDAKGKHTYSYSVLDGKQRMTTVFSYINGEFALSDDSPDVEIEDETYAIAGKYFDDQAENIQREILMFKFNIQSFENVSDAMIEDIFFRLNSSTPLTRPQKSKALSGCSNAIFINDILASRFFTEKCNFTKRQRVLSADLCTLLQSMMLLDSKYRGYDYASISDDEAMNYSRWINGNYPEECKDRVKKITGFLDNVFYMKDKNLRKVHIPILFLVADLALQKSITGTNFRRWFTDFFETHKEEYGQYCSSGSIKKEKTYGRIEVMTRWFKDYFNLLEESADEQEADSESNESDTGSNSETMDDGLKLLTDTADSDDIHAADDSVDSGTNHEAESKDSREDSVDTVKTDCSSDISEIADDETNSEMEITSDNTQEEGGDSNGTATEEPSSQDSCEGKEDMAENSVEETDATDDEEHVHEDGDGAPDFEDTPDSENAHGEISNELLCHVAEELAV